MSNEQISKSPDNVQAEKSDPVARVHAPPVQMKGPPRRHPESAAFQDLETERFERQHRTERLKKMRLAAQATEG